MLNIIKGHKGIFWEHMWQHHGILKNRKLWCNVQEDKGSRLERKPGIQNDGIEDSKSNIIEVQRQVLRIWENYITELYDQPNWQLNLEVKPEQEVNTDENGSYIVQNEMEKAIEEVRNKKATKDYNEPGHVIKLGRWWSQTNDTTGQCYVYMKLESSPKISLKSQWVP